MRGVKQGDRVRSAYERVMDRVVITESGCWEFTGSRQKRGHGLVRVGKRLAKAHRVTYEAVIGPIPAGLDLDHVICQNPPCVNPAHLEPVTRGENGRREADRRTTCRRGHPWTPENVVYVGKNRTCATCLIDTRARAREARSSKR